MLERDVDISQFKHEDGSRKYFELVDLAPGNLLPVRLRRIVKALGCSPYEVLDRWGLEDPLEVHSVIEGAVIIEETINTEQARATRRKPQKEADDGPGS